MPKQTNWNDADLLAALRGSTAPERRAAEEYLWAHWRAAALGYIVKAGGAREVAEEIFDDAFIEFYRRVREGGYQGEGSLQAYFMGFIKNFWAKARVKQGRRWRLFGLFQQETLAAPEPASQADRYEDAEALRFLYTILEKTGKHCRQIQQLFGEGFELKEIAERMPELKTADRAKTEKKRCTDRMEAELKKHPAEWTAIFKAYFQRKSGNKK